MTGRYLPDTPSKTRHLVPALLAFACLTVLTPARAAAPAAQPSPAAPVPTTAVQSMGIGWSNVSPMIERQLDSDQKTLHVIFTRLNNADPATGDLVLADLSKQVGGIQQRTHAAIGQIQSYDSVVTSFLQVLGDKPVPNEDPSITAQRQRMMSDSQSIKTTLVRARLYELQARELGTIIDSRRSQIQQATIARRTSSPLSPHFWHDLLTEKADNASPFFRDGVLANWIYLLAGAILSFVLTGIVARPLVRTLGAAGKRLGLTPATPSAEGDSSDAPEEPLSISVMPIVLTGLLCGMLAPLIWTIWEAATMDANGGPIAVTISNTLPVCGFILGAGLPILGRAGLRATRDSGARRALRGVDWMLAAAVLGLDLLRAFQAQHVFSLNLILLLQIAFSVLVVLATLSTCRSLGRQTETRLLAPSVVGFSALLTCVTIVSVLLGYVSFAFSLTGWLLVLGVGIAIVSLLGLFWRSCMEHVLSAQGAFGRRLLPLGVSARLLSQATVVLTGIGNIFLLLLLFSIVQSDGDFNLATIFGSLGLLFSGSNIRGIPISLDTVLICIAILIAAYYAIRQSRRWMSEKLFPTTRLDIGSQTSIISIFSYCCWILVGLTVLSIAGVSVKNLTWVVSALSVGIGFGLQSIVQNFVSGIILLAERPVRVGDVVEIAGTKGDVRRISVRATNLALSDGSTMIVPNSQFITGTVKNATFGGSGSAMTLSFTVPTTTDLDQARAMLLEVAAKRPEVLSSPAPKVRVTAIGAENVTMTLGFNLSSVRDNGSVQDAILFDIFRRFHADDIAIATA